MFEITCLAGYFHLSTTYTRRPNASFVLLEFPRLSIITSQFSTTFIYIAAQIMLSPTDRLSSPIILLANVPPPQTPIQNLFAQPIPSNLSPTQNPPPSLPALQAS